MKKTDIEWCDMTWNPISGCLHNCKPYKCYAESIVKRFERKGRSTGKNHVLDEPIKKVLMLKYGACQERTIPYPYGFDPTFHRYRLDQPAKVKKPKNVFVVSMGDLFGDWVPDEWIAEVFKACEAAPQHRYLFLTKNPERYSKIITPEKIDCYFGTTITSITDWSNRTTSHLISIPYGKRFLSVEPIMGDISSTIAAYPVNWVIIGGETGSRNNKVAPKREWIESIVKVCRKKFYPVPVYMKDSLIPVVGEENMIREFPWKEN